MNANLSRPETPTNDPPTEERLAKLTGFNNPSTLPPDSSNPDGSSATISPLLSDEDLEEQITRHSFASSPLSKLLIVAVGVFFIVFVASLFLSQFQSPGESVASHQREVEVDKESPLLSRNDEDKEKSELLSELALREQEDHLKNLSQEKPPVENPQERRVVRPTPARRTTYQRPVVRQVSLPPRPQPVAHSTTPRVPPTYRPVSVRSAVTVRLEDSVQLWQEMAQIGSFGGASPSNSSQGRNFQESRVPHYQPKVAQVSHQEVREPVASPSPGGSPSSDFHTVVFGQSVTSVLESPIAWEEARSSTRGSQPTDERYLMTLNEPLKDKFGNEEIPSGSQLVVRLASSGALVNLVAESIIVNGTEVKVSEGTLKIRGAGNQPLIAESKTIGGDGSNGLDGAQALAEVLSIAGDFADIPGSRSISSLYRTIAGGSSPRRLTTPVTIWFVPAGTELEVYVNKPFSVSLPEAPLELDMSAIESEAKVAEVAIEPEASTVTLEYEASQEVRE